MPIVMILCGLPNGSPTEHDGEYLQEFNFEADDGQGLCTMTPDLSKAKKFANMKEALVFYRRRPRCKPRRPDGHPNRPLTATNWIFDTIE